MKGRVTPICIAVATITKIPQHAHDERRDPVLVEPRSVGLRHPGGKRPPKLGEFGERAAGVLDDIAKLFFGIIGVIVRLAPIGAFGAMAFTVGRYGLGALVNLGALIATFYLTSILFVLIVLGAIARASGFSILKFLAYIREELLIVFGASSSEAALPLIMAKLERLGAGKATVGKPSDRPACRSRFAIWSIDVCAPPCGEWPVPSSPGKG